MTLIKDLLTENRFWTFWSGDWSIRINVYWQGQTKWSEVIQAVKNKMLKDYPNKLQTIHDMGFERQVQLREPDIKFA